MKKLMGFLFVLVFILGIIFVLLPFLETTPPSSAATAVQARPRPQIFTSNPLTTLVKRIVNALQTEWDKKREKRRLVTARLQKEKQIPSTDYRAALLKTLPEQEENLENPLDLQEDQGDSNWLIVPQISPKDVAAKGLHEVNTNEELRESTDTLTNIPSDLSFPIVNPTQENISDSSEKEPILLVQTGTNLHLSPSVQPTKKSTEQTLSLSETEKAWQKLEDIMYPERKIKKIIRDMADVKFGLTPATPERQQEKESFIKNKTEKAIKEFRHRKWDEITKLFEEETPLQSSEDYLGNYLRAAKREGKEPRNIPMDIYFKEGEKIYRVETSSDILSLLSRGLERLAHQLNTVQSNTNMPRALKDLAFSVISQVPGLPIEEKKKTEETPDTSFELSNEVSVTLSTTMQTASALSAARLRSIIEDDDDDSPSTGTPSPPNTLVDEVSEEAMLEKPGTGISYIYKDEKYTPLSPSEAKVLFDYRSRDQFL